MREFTGAVFEAFFLLLLQRNIEVEVKASLLANEHKLFYFLGILAYVALVGIFGDYFIMIFNDFH